jgi:hypothetical protein
MLLTAFCRDRCAKISALTTDNAPSGHHFTHCGVLCSLSVQLLQVKAVCFDGCRFMAPNVQELTHQPQPLQAFSSTRMMPVLSSADKAFLGQAETHGGSSQCLHVRAKLAVGLIRIIRMRLFEGLKVFSFAILQAYSQTWQPTHFCISAVTNFLSCGRAILFSSKLG